MALSKKMKTAVEMSLTQTAAVVAERTGGTEAAVRRMLASRSARTYREALLAELELLAESAAVVCRASAACTLAHALSDAEVKSLLEVVKLATLLERTAAAAGPDPLEAILQRLGAVEEGA